MVFPVFSAILTTTAHTAETSVPPSPLSAEIMRPIENATRSMWKDVPVVPIMGTGATDSLYFRQAGIPMYGVSGLFGDIDDNRAHGRDAGSSAHLKRPTYAPG